MKLRLTRRCIASTLALGWGCVFAAQSATPLKSETLPASTPASREAATSTGDDPKAYVAFGQDFAALCVGRDGVEITVHNTHPTRTLRAWFDRYHMGTGTGDRSHADLAPNAEPEPMGCSKTDYGVQEWRLVRAQFID